MSRVRSSKGEGERKTRNFHQNIYNESRQRVGGSAQSKKKTRVLFAIEHDWSIKLTQEMVRLKAYNPNFMKTFQVMILPQLLLIYSSIEDKMSFLLDPKIMQIIRFLRNSQEIKNLTFERFWEQTLTSKCSRAAKNHQITMFWAFKKFSKCTALLWIKNDTRMTRRYENIVQKLKFLYF